MPGILVLGESRCSQIDNHRPKQLKEESVIFSSNFPVKVHQSREKLKEVLPIENREQRMHP